MIFFSISKIKAVRCETRGLFVCPLAKAWGVFAVVA